jgi:protein-glutamine gamma-glutamyltransferase
MARTFAFSLGLGVLIAWNWARLEEPSPSVGPLALMVLLGIAPALLPPLRWPLVRQGVVLAVAEVAALLVAASIALKVDRAYHVGQLVDRVAGGVGDFYDVLVPFDGAAHPLMHGVLLLAVFLFTMLCALAVASRRPVAAILALTAGAGWPATILPGSDDLGRGAFILAAALALVAWLRPETRRAPPQVLTGTAILVLALILSSSGSVAKGQFLGWQDWDLYNKPGKPLSVEYVWKANYEGITFPKERTRVFTVHAPKRSVYWRATTLDAFADDHWDEDLISLYSEVPSNPVDLTGDPLLPDGARDPSRHTKADVTIDALRDRRLVGPSQPVVYDSRSVRNVQYLQGGVALAFSPLSQGDEYTVWGYTPQPSPAQLAKSPADYPPEISVDRRFLTLGHSSAAPPFRTFEHELWAADYFQSSEEGQRYRPLWLATQRIAGKARNPYAATVALEAWFRSSGGFTYDEQPPATRRDMPPLVQFVTETKRGYCQHFAGAMALMLRHLGIPARVAAGFTSGSFDSRRETWTVYDKDAHTWVEVWFQGYGWLPFDPTPSRGTLGGPYTTSSLSFDANGAATVLAASALAGLDLLRFELNNLAQEGREGAASGGESPTDPANAPSAGGGGGVGAGAILALVALGVVLLFVLAKVAFRRSRFLTRDPRRLAGACRREVVDFLLDQRIAVPRSVGPRELGDLLGSRTGIEATDFAEAVGLARFGPDSTAATAAREARRELRAVRRRLRRVLPLGGRVRGLFSLRSILTAR